MGKEIWKDIQGYKGLYQVSNLGNVKSLGNNKRRKEKILKPCKTKDGYLFIGLHKEGKTKKFRINRLVAIAFIPNPNNYPMVNHKKEFEKENNRVDNLEWCDNEYNINYGTHNKRQAKSKSKEVYQYTIDGTLVKKWESTNECGRNGFSHSAVSLCCNNKYNFRSNKYKGYIWSYKEFAKEDIK